MNSCPHIDNCAETVLKSHFRVVCSLNYKQCSTWIEKQEEDKKTPSEWAEELKILKGDPDGSHPE